MKLKTTYLFQILLFIYLFSDPRTLFDILFGGGNLSIISLFLTYFFTLIIFTVSLRKKWNKNSIIFVCILLFMLIIDVVKGRPFIDILMVYMPFAFLISLFEFHGNRILEIIYTPTLVAIFINILLFVLQNTLLEDRYNSFTQYGSMSGMDNRFIATYMSPAYLVLFSVYALYFSQSINNNLLLKGLAIILSVSLGLMTGSRGFLIALFIGLIYLLNVGLKKQFKTIAIGTAIYFIFIFQFEHILNQYIMRLDTSYLMIDINTRYDGGAGFINLLYAMALGFPESLLYGVTYYTGGVMKFDYQGVEYSISNSIAHLVGNYGLWGLLYLFFFISLFFKNMRHKTQYHSENIFMLFSFFILIMFDSLIYNALFVFAFFRYLYVKK
jgi:hypothetical protein